ncbi:LOW QUALITY PROTEIN: putative defense protein Hdd11 [Nematolebias whitei]|uniref:LOW QUALITY PROTEIN: putative defense protein Hdd11 n=1 Tax=Nematolebias whitei TaxID=451745 RepID=UPI00189B0AB6|nr:LOW QUALITY PROTEIN: putative defense protein Hdd11 [Nematolebias whitei]
MTQQQEFLKKFPSWLLCLSELSIPSGTMLLLALFFLKALCFVGCYPNGAPTGACEDMIPRHGVLPQPSLSPYSILTNTETFQPGKPITVTITGPAYRGVLLEARIQGSTNALGSWKLPPPDTKFLQCAGNLQGAVTQSNTNLKGNSTVYNWIPPNTMSPVYFIATVAQQRSVFWVNVRSNTLINENMDNLRLATDAGSQMAEEQTLLLLVICLLALLIQG